MQYLSLHLSQMLPQANMICHIFHSHKSFSPRNVHAYNKQKKISAFVLFCKSEIISKNSSFLPQNARILAVIYQSGILGYFCAGFVEGGNIVQFVYTMVHQTDREKELR